MFAPMRMLQLGFLSLIALGLYFVFENESGAGEPNGPAHQGRQGHFKKILLGSRSNPVGALPSVTGACQELWNRVRELDLQRMNEDIFRGCLLLPKQGECAETPPELVASHAAYVEECKLFMDSGYDKRAHPELEEKAQSCFLSLVGYRAAIGSWLTRDQQIAEIASVEALGDRLLNEMFLSLHGEGASVASVRVIANRVNELDANVYSTSKITAVANVMDALSDPSTENWNKAKQAFENLERFNSADPELAQLGVWVRTEGMKPDRLREEATRMVQEAPQSGLGYFYLAFAEAGSGNREKIGALFMSAVQAEPNNPTFVRALESYRAKRPVPPPFHFDFDFRIAELMDRG